VILKHLKYASYVLRHKAYVGLACVMTAVADDLTLGTRLALLWRGLTHDLSKLRPSEWIPYSTYFNGPRPPSEQTKAAFDRAWLLHIHRNPHHWQHHLLQEDDGPLKRLPISLLDILEMVCDWRGAGRAQGKGDDLREWYESNRQRQIMAEPSRRVVDALVLGGGPRVIADAEIVSMDPYADPPAVQVSFSDAPDEVPPPCARRGGCP
jgi:hypothetical protein